MTVWHLAGPSGLGKTLLLEALIPLLPGTVQVLKHSHHPLEPDTVGKDTERLRQARATLRIHPDGMVLREAAMPLFDVVSWYASRCDHLLIEGLKSLDTPKIYLSQTPVASPLSVRVAIGPQPPMPAEILWLPTHLPLTPARAHDTAALLMHHNLVASFSESTLLDAIKALEH